MSFLSSLLGTRSSDDGETRALISQLEAIKKKSSLKDTDGKVDYAISVIDDASQNVDLTLGMRIGQPIFDLVYQLLTHEPMTISGVKDFEGHSLAEMVDYRNRLRDGIRMLSNERYFLGKWKETVSAILMEIYKDLPDQAFVDPRHDGSFDEYSRLSPLVPLHTFVKEVPVLIHKIIATVFASDLRSDKLFESLREQLLVNACEASNISPEDRHRTTKKLVMPEEKSGLDDNELLHLYLQGTPFLPVFLMEIPIYIPEAVRYEHTWILAGTGHGKTQTLQYLIAADLEEAIKQKRSVVVMDGQGDLIETLMRSKYFEDPNLRERFIYIDPQDMERPVGLNLFDVDLSASAMPSAVARETILNNTIELYDFFFGALLGAELTQKQGLVFRYLAVLMMRIPGANIHTLRELMEDGQKFKPYMATLGGSARTFFETRFFDRGFNETKKQILNRLWGVLSNQTLDRMMSAPKNSLDLYQSLQNGSIIFINTAKDFFGEEGSAIFSRMFIALLGQAHMRRAAIEKHERTPTYIYLDEAERVVDVTLNRMLAQIRKYKGAITFAHQNLEQLEPQIRAGILANTSIKLAGGVSARDATALSGEFRCESNFLLSQRKRKEDTQFACFVRNITEKAVTLTIPFGHIESQGRIDDAIYSELVEQSRQKYGVAVQVEELIPVAPGDSPGDWLTEGAPVVEPPSEVAPFVETADPMPQQLPNLPISSPSIEIARVAPIPQPIQFRDSGGGGVKHKYIEHLIKELGEERGFRATIEESIHDGSGRVDVILRRQKLSFAFEISVTTTKDHELANVEKCLALPFTHVIMMASHAKHLKGLSMHIGKALEEEETKRVSFLLPEDLPGFLDGYPLVDAPKEKVVKGYTVRSRAAVVNPTEAVARRRAIASVVARSLGS